MEDDIELSRTHTPASTIVDDAADASSAGSPAPSDDEFVRAQSVSPTLPPVEDEEARRAHLANPNLIIGAGPSGLKSALELAIRGEPSEVFDMREDFTRPQRLITISGGELEKFIALIPEGEHRDNALRMHAKLKAEHTMQIKDIQEVLRLCILHGELEDGTPISEKVQLRLGSNITRIDDTNMKAYFVEGGEEKSINFNNILDATGGRDIKHLFDSGLPGVERVESEVQPAHTAYFSIAMELPRGTRAAKKVVELDGYSTELLLTKARELGWKSMQPPYQYFGDNIGSAKADDVVKIHITGQIPESILSISDKGEREVAMQKWAKMICSIWYPELDASKLQPRYTEPGRHPDDAAKTERRVRKKKLATLGFKYVLKEVEHPAVSMGSGAKRSTLFFIGDSAFTPFVANLEGIRVGFQSARLAAEAIHASHESLEAVNTTEYTTELNRRRKISRQGLSVREKFAQRKLAIQWKEYHGLAKRFAGTPTMHEKFTAKMAAIEAELPEEMVAKMKADVGDDE